MALSEYVRPQKPNDKLDAIRKAVLRAPIIADVYKHYRGENLPEDRSFLANTVADSFGISADRVEEFIGVLLEDLEAAKLMEDQGGGKKRVIDITHTPADASGSAVADEHLKKVSKVSLSSH